MKTFIAAVVLTLAVGFYGISSVHAAAFNDRGPELGSQVTPTQTNNRAADFANTSLGYTERGADIRQASFTPSNNEPKVCEIAMVHGFNEREYNKRTC